MLHGPIVPGARYGDSVRLDVVRGWPRIAVMLDDAGFFPEKGLKQDVSVPFPMTMPNEPTVGFPAVLMSPNAPDIKVRVVPSEKPFGARAERRAQAKAARKRKGKR